MVQEVVSVVINNAGRREHEWAAVPSFEGCHRCIGGLSVVSFLLPFYYLILSLHKFMLSFAQAIRIFAN